MTARYNPEDLSALATTLLTVSGLDPTRAAIVADTLLEGELLGFSTHGMQLLPLHLKAIDNGDTAKSGDPLVVSDYGSAMTWDGNWLPGPVLVRSALDAAYDRMNTHPAVTIAIRRAGHIGCLATYAQAAAQRGYFLIISSSDPTVATVAPHGGIEGRMTPNPIAAGWPTDTIPVVIDTCPSMATNGMVNRYAKAGERCPGEWLIDAGGNATTDPNALTSGGAILPVGGIELGHKGFALGLLVEALTSGLSGAGRSNPEPHWGASVFIMVMNPELFGGAAKFKQEAQWLGDSCRSSKPRPGGRVRMPGERSHSARQDALHNGITLHPQTLPAIAPWAEKMGVQMPKPRAN